MFFGQNLSLLFYNIISYLTHRDSNNQDQDQTTI
jgi:hypothetical protein